MSKNQVPMLSYGSGYVFSDSSIGYLEGRLLTIIESLGLRETQEEAVKSLIRNELWTMIREQGVYVTPEEHTAIRERHSRENTLIGNTPVGVATSN